MHISSFMYAKALEGELVMPPSLHRATKTFEANTTWHMAPAASLLDVEAITEYWSNNGMVIHTVND